LKYSLIALDVDGTVKPRGRPISARVRDAIAAARAAGVHVTLATGRMYRSAEPFVAELGLTDPIICYGGAVITDPKSGHHVHRRGIPLPLARRIVDAGRARGLGLLASFDDYMLYEGVPETSTFATYARRNFARIVPDLLASLPDEPCHLALITEERLTHGLVMELRAEFGDALHVTSGHPLLAEIYHPEVDKGAALATVAGMLGVPREEVIAAGDDLNDVAMLRWAGLGLAMADAPLEVLAAADRVAPTADADGVAEIIEQFVLGNKTTT
jgi:Cof subfamily protein (haloacid dehalogenase superfamily)